MRQENHLLTEAEEADLTSLVQDIIDKELAPSVAIHEHQGSFPRHIFHTIGNAGLLSLPYPEEYGGGNLPYKNYLQVLEQVSSVWASIGVGMSVHALACHPIAYFGSDAQRATFLPHMLSGEALGAYCLSEAHAGSDPRAMLTTAQPQDGGYVLNGTKAWITHGGEADFYMVFAITNIENREISCFYVPADTPGINADAPERKMGLRASRTSSVHFDGVWVPHTHRIGEEGEGLSIAFSALDSGRLGIAAVATGVSQAALSVATDYARTRVAFDRPIFEHQGIAFLLADMATKVEVSRVMYERGAILKGQGLPHSKEAAMAKLVSTDNAMAVTTDAVQVLGGAGYTEDFPVERYMREAKIMQIFEGTNQIQRLVISRHL